MPKNGRLSPKEFDNIHFLNDRGLEITEITRITGRSDDTIRRTLKVQTFEGYLEQNKMIKDARIKRESKQRNETQINYQEIASQVYDELRQVIISLQSISDKIYALKADPDDAYLQSIYEAFGRDNVEVIS